jgi:hypothetical protein
MIAYIEDLTSLSRWQEWVIMASAGVAVILCVFRAHLALGRPHTPPLLSSRRLNLKGISAVGNVSALLFVVIILPFVVEAFAVLGEGRMRPRVWVEVRATLAWPSAGVQHCAHRPVATLTWACCSTSCSLTTAAGTRSARSPARSRTPSAHTHWAWRCAASPYR